jgi:hypothetical protein
MMGATMKELKALFDSTGHAPAQGQRRSLRHDDGGAMMVMGIFMAVILVGAIYYVMGIGQSIIYHERMQDAADASAFGAAVIHARGMNILAFLNIISAAVMAVLVALKVLEYLLLAAFTIATAICALCSCPGCCGCCFICPVAVVLGYGYDYVSEIRQAAEPPIETILDINKQIMNGVRMGIPYVAQAKVYDYGTDTFDKPTNMAIMVPLFGELAAEPDDSDLFCDKAANVGGRMAGTMLGLWPIRAFVGTAVESISGMFCDDDEYAHRVLEDAEMGDDNFQLQTYVRGDPPFSLYEKGVGVAAWGRTDEATDYELMETLTHYSYAQAEYYMDTEDDRDEWLWRLDWRARLRRWELGAGFGEVAGALGSAVPLGDLNFSVH